MKIGVKATYTDGVRGKIRGESCSLKLKRKVGTALNLYKTKAHKTSPKNLPRISDLSITGIGTSYFIAFIRTILLALFRCL
jgi:hypothetical protein